MISGDGYYMVTPPPGYLGKTYIGGRYVYEHRLIVEQRLGRLLTKDETVDHDNGNKLDNSNANLKVLTRSDHGKKTILQLRRYDWQNPNFNCSNCDKPFHVRPWKLKKFKMLFHNRMCYREFVKDNNWNRNNFAK